MKWLLTFLFVLFLCGIGVGFARGWFAVSKGPDTGANKVDMHVTVDRDKIKADAAKVSEKVKELPKTIKKGASNIDEHEDEDKGTPGTL
jgi:hypothetical protein